MLPHKWQILFASSRCHRTVLLNVVLHYVYTISIVLKMADPISAASAIITLVTFGIQSSSMLYQTFKEFNSHHKHVRELKTELDALSLVLASIHQAILDNEADFTPLKLPLFRCGSACIEFNMVVRDATKQSHGSLASFRDWAKLKYLGDDIDGFKALLANYKSTITIALCDANL